MSIISLIIVKKIQIKFCSNIYFYDNVNSSLLLNGTFHSQSFHWNLIYYVFFIFTALLFLHLTVVK